MSPDIKAPLTMFFAGIYVLYRTWSNGSEGARMDGLVLVIIGLIDAIARWVA